jgi:ABC-type antimicrobial peptide transport system permease subunit
VSIAGGVAGTLLTSLAVSSLAKLVDLDIVVSASTIAWALAAAAFSGLAAGYYPARRATRIDVIAAVRAE